MRRITASLAALPILILLLAGPAAAAPPVKDSGTQDFVFAFSSSCGPSTCTDTLLDVFAVGDETIVVCVNEITYNTRTGRITSEDSACSAELPADTLVVEDDLSSASVPPTDVTFFNCNQQGCVEGDTITVSLELTGFGPITTDRQRSTFNDGTCTFTFSSSGEQRQATGTITLDGEVLEAQGSIGSGKFSFTQHCK